MTEICTAVPSLLLSSILLFLVINIFRVAFRGAQPNISVLQPVCYEAGDGERVWFLHLSSTVRPE